MPVNDEPDCWPLDDLPIGISVFGNPTLISQKGLNLDIELPDVDSRDKDYWRRVWAVGWKPQLRGKIADPEEEHGDPEWAKLKVYPFCEVWFDIEEGIRFRLRGVQNLPPAMDLVYSFVAKGISLIDPDDGRALVWVNQSVFGYRVSDASAFFKAALLEPEMHSNGGVVYWRPHKAHLEPGNPYADHQTQTFGYLDPRVLADGRWGAIQRQYRKGAGAFDIVAQPLYSTGLMDGRWRYRTHEDAREALDAWDGIGSPKGWYHEQRKPSAAV